MFGQKDWMVVLMINLLGQSVESRMPTKCVSEELKQSVILRIEMWDR